MATEQVWSRKFKGDEFELSSLGEEWKSFMKECLLQADIFENTNSYSVTDVNVYLDPNLVMDMRHKMIRSQNFDTFSIPKETVKTNALKLLREKKKKNFIKQREEIRIKNEIEKLNHDFENQRFHLKNQLEKLENVKRPKTATKIEKPLIKFSGVCESSCQDFRTFLGEHGEPTSMPDNIFLQNRESHVKTAEINGDSLQLVPCNRKGSIASSEEGNKFEISQVGEWNCVQVNDKNLIMQKFMKSVCLIEDKNGIHQKDSLENHRGNQVDVIKDNEKNSKKLNEKLNDINGKCHKRIIENAWKTWKNFTLRSLQKKKEKARYRMKIEQFLERLENINAQNENLKKKKADIDRNSGTVTSDIRSVERSRKFSAVKEKSQKKVTADKVSRDDVNKQETLKQLTSNIRTSQSEALARLKEIEKQNPHNEKVKVLKNLVNAFGGSENLGTVHSIPEFIVRMERRREERMKRWNEIHQRKIKIEAQKEQDRKQKQLEIMEAEENEIRKRREELKKKRRMAKKIRKRQLEEQEKLNSQTKTAELHYQKRVVRRRFDAWKLLVDLRYRQEQQAISFSEKRLIQEGFSRWRTHVEQTKYLKERRADEFHQKIILKISFRIWCNVCLERIRQHQVALDFNDLKVVEYYFKKWLDFTLEEQLRYLTFKEMASSFYEKKLKTKYFKMLQNYPSVKRSEIEKEQRKWFWRHKVQSVLPDYQPEIVYEF